MSQLTLALYLQQQKVRMHRRSAVHCSKYINKFMTNTLFTEPLQAHLNSYRAAYANF